MELIRKGKVPNLSQLTQKAMLEVGARAMRAHLDRVTDKLAKRHSLAPGAKSRSALSKITGKGIARMQQTEVTMDAGEVVGIIPLAQHMVTQEFGDVIRAKGKGYLAVPLPAALNGDGTPKKASPRLWARARVIKSRKGNLLIAVRNGRQWTPLYVLKEQVKVPARLGLRKELKKDRKKLMDDVRAGIKALLST